MGLGFLLEFQVAGQLARGGIVIDLAPGMFYMACSFNTPYRIERVINRFEQIGPKMIAQFTVLGRYLAN